MANHKDVEPEELSRHDQRRQWNRFFSSLFKSNLLTLLGCEVFLLIIDLFALIIIQQSLLRALILALTVIVCRNADYAKGEQADPNHVKSAQHVRHARSNITRE